MINITMTAKQQDDQVKVSFNGNSKEGSYIQGNYFVGSPEYEEVRLSDLRRKVHEKIESDISAEDIAITSTSMRENEKLKVNFEANAMETSFTGHCFLEPNEYKTLMFTDFGQTIYQKIIEDFKGDAE